MGILVVLVVLIAAYFFIDTDSKTDKEVIATTNEINSETKKSEADAQDYTEANPNNLGSDDDAQVSADNNPIDVDRDEQSSKNDNQTNASQQDNPNVNNSTSFGLPKDCIAANAALILRPVYRTSSIKITFLSSIIKSIFVVFASNVFSPLLKSSLKKVMSSKPN